MQVQIHLPAHQLASGPPTGNGFYPTLAAALHARGVDVIFNRRLSVFDGPEYTPDAFHFVHQGLICRGNVLNTGVAYLRGY